MNFTMVGNLTEILQNQVLATAQTVVHRQMNPANHPNYVYARGIYVWLVPMMVAVLFIAILGNGLIVASAPWLNRPISPYHRLCISLALADAWAASLLATGLVVNSYMPVVLNIFPSTKCLNCVLEIFRIAGMLTSNLHILALAIHQFVGIIYPLKYKLILTTKRQRIFVLMLWILPILYIFVWFVVYEDDGFRVSRCKYDFYQYLPFRLTVFVSFIIPLFATFALYAIILFTLLKAKAKCDTDIRKSMHHGSLRRVKSKLKLVWTTLLILSTFTLSWGVCVLYFVMVCKKGCIFIYLQSISFHVGFLLNSTVNFLVMLKLMLNPLIYALRMRHIRASVASLLSFLCFRHFGRTLAINQISMNFMTTTLLPDSEPNSRRCSRYLSRMSSDIVPPLSEINSGKNNGFTTGPKRAASIAGAITSRNGSITHGHIMARNTMSFRPQRTIAEDDEWGKLMDKRKH